MKTDSVTRVAAWMLLGSAATGAAGAVFLLAMFAFFGSGQQAAGMTVGRWNDTLVLVSYPLAIPALLVLHGRPHGRSEASAAVVTFIGLAGIAGVVALQALLVADVLTFEQQIGPVTIAFLVLGGWFVLTDARNRAAGPWPNGLVMSVLATLYVGYPLWAYRVARALLAPSPIGAARAVARHAET